MAKCYGSVVLGDEERLAEVAREAGVDLYAEAVWDEAKEYMEENATDEAEVRIAGLDYVEVYK